MKIKADMYSGYIDREAHSGQRAPTVGIFVPYLVTIRPNTVQQHYVCSIQSDFVLYDRKNRGYSTV